jgi:catechol 2,3-dioxygenase-like lactoylglutathione lyase family enzyme
LIAVGSHYTGIVPSCGRLNECHIRPRQSDRPRLVFSYDQLEPRLPAAANRPGFGHIAFEVEDVPAARKEVSAARGKPVGQIVTLTTATGGMVTWCYVTDPEGNMIELQSWQTSR